MPVNWDLFTPVDTSSSYDAGWDRGKGMVEDYQLKGALAAFAKNPTDPKVQSALARLSPEFAMKLGSHQWEMQEKQAERDRIAAAYAQGPEGLMRGGYADEAKAVQGYQTGMRTEHAELAKQASPVAYLAKKRPYAERRAFIMANREKLHLFTDQQLAEFDPTDENLDNVINNAMSTEELQTRDKVVWHTRLDGSTYANDFMGNIIGENGQFFDEPVAPPSAVPQSGQVSPPTDPSISYGNPEDTPEQAEIRRLALDAIRRGGDEASIWADAARDGVYP